MFNVGDTVIYGPQGICKIEDKTERPFKGEMMEYFVLKPVYEKASTIFLPLGNKTLMSRMRQVLSKEEIYEIIKAMPDEETIWIENENLRKVKYAEIISRGEPLELVRLIKTLFLHEKLQKERGRKFHLTDEAFLKDAEKILYDEFAHVLDLQYDQVEPFIMGQIDEVKEK